MYGDYKMGTTKKRKKKKKKTNAFKSSYYRSITVINVKTVAFKTNAGSGRRISTDYVRTAPPHPKVHTSLAKDT